MNQKIVNKIGWLGSILGIVLFSSFLDQIRLNLAGQKGSAILPIVMVVNCFTWSLYGWLKSPRDLPLFLCNILGVIVGLATAITAII